MGLPDNPSFLCQPAFILKNYFCPEHKEIDIKSHEEEDVWLQRKDARDLSLFLHSSHTEAWLMTVTSENKVIQVFLRCWSY